MKKLTENKLLLEIANVKRLVLFLNVHTIV